MVMSPSLVEQVKERATKERERPSHPAAFPPLPGVPAGRYGDPAEFGAVGAFLCSELASYVTGTTVRVDGGLVRSL